jgi:hypothetical protein
MDQSLVLYIVYILALNHVKMVHLLHGVYMLVPEHVQMVQSLVLDMVYRLLLLSSPPQTTSQAPTNRKT